MDSAVLVYVADVEVGAKHRNAVPADPEAPVFVAARSQSSDLRYALEALTHMARTYVGSLRAVTEAQADWVKTIAMAKGLPRNVAMPPRVIGHDDDEEEDDEDPVEVAEPARTSGVEEALKMVAPYLPGLMESWQGKKAAASAEPRRRFRHSSRRANEPASLRGRGLAERG